MRNLEVIENELAAAREALSKVTGTPAEVYSRIVGYYRSVRNWNRGKREEYGERVMFRPDESLLAACSPRTDSGRGAFGEQDAGSAKADTANETEHSAARVLLFVRPACSACPPAKAAAGRLGLPIDLYDADTETGLAEAVKRNVLSTPTAILISDGGKELGRARDAETIGRLLSQPIAV
jgi:ribonucleoside-triphosphate reductase